LEGGQLARRRPVGKKAASWQLRGELVAKVCISVPAIYGIGQLKHEELEDAVGNSLPLARDP